MLIISRQPFSMNKRKRKMMNTYDLPSKQQIMLALPTIKIFPIIINVKNGINQFEIESRYICTSTLKAFENYFIMNTTTSHRMRENQ